MIAEVIGDVKAALGGEAALVVADAGCVVANVIAAVHTAAHEDAVLLLIMPDVTAIDRVMLLAALNPLAIALAPSRIGAIDVADGATPAHVAAAARHLALAQSTTGQSLRIA